MWTHLFPDLQRSLAQWLRLLVLPSLPVQNSQVVEGGGDLTGHNSLFIEHLQQSADQNHSRIKTGSGSLTHARSGAPCRSALISDSHHRVPPERGKKNGLRRRNLLLDFQNKSSTSPKFPPTKSL